MTSHCSFCTKPAEEVETLVAGAGVFICNECVDLVRGPSSLPSATAAPASACPLWEQIDDQALLDHLPRIEAVRGQVDDATRLGGRGATTGSVVGSDRGSTGHETTIGVGAVRRVSSGADVAQKPP